MLKIVAVLGLLALPLFSQDQVTGADPLRPAFLPQPISRVKPELSSSTAFGDNVIAHVADGGGWQTTITVLNLRPTPTTFTVACYGDSGTPQAFSWVGVGSFTTLNGTLGGGSHSLQIMTAGMAPATSQGWCYVSSPGTGPNPSTQLKNDVGTFAVFSYAPTGQQVSVPASSWFLGNSSNSLILAYDNTNGYSYGVALADSNPFPFSGLPKDLVSVTINDQSGNLIATDSFQMISSSHLSFVLADRYPAIANTKGTVTFSIQTSSGIGTLAGIGIRAAPSGAFTSVGMIEPATY
jgi:hypothetical protein